MSHPRSLVAAAFLFAAAPAASLACACGCGVFAVGNSTLIPSGPGLAAWIDLDHLDQTENWRGGRRAPGSGNSDKRILTDFATLGAQVMNAKGWGVMVEIPVLNRSFTTTGDDGALQRFHHTSLGDIRIMGVYSGFTADMATGIAFGLKLPTGGFRNSGFDRDVQPGSGTTDVILGGYHRGDFGLTSRWSWFAQGQWDHPLNSRSGYRPGGELDASAGLAWSATPATAKLGVTPMLQLIASVRARDSGAAADPESSGYERLLIAPGVELKDGRWKLYGDVELPVRQRVNGRQLVAPVLFKLSLSHRF